MNEPYSFTQNQLAEWGRREAALRTRNAPHDHSTQDAGDECFWIDGCPLLRGRCDTCGAPCDDVEGNCTTDTTHPVALEA